MQGLKRVQGAGQLLHVGKLTIYTTPEGQFITPCGNVRVAISADEARELLEDTISRATRFSQPVSKGEKHDS